jgi:hypothetical protein
MVTVFLRDGFKAQGEVRLLGANIGGQLDCSGGTSRIRVEMPSWDKISKSMGHFSGGI